MDALKNKLRDKIDRPSIKEVGPTAGLVAVVVAAALAAGVGFVIYRRRRRRSLVQRLQDQGRHSTIFAIRIDRFLHSQPVTEAELTLRLPEGADVAALLAELLRPPDPPVAPRAAGAEARASRRRTGRRCR